MFIFAALALAVGAFTLAVLKMADSDSQVSVSGATPEAGADGGTESTAPRIVEEYLPGRGVETVQQTDVGLDLSPGWALTDFTLNGVAIPDDQLDVTQELDRYVFTPGEGKAITAFEPQTNCATARVYQLTAGDRSSRTERWCFEIL